MSAYVDPVEREFSAMHRNALNADLADGLTDMPEKPSRKWHQGAGTITPDRYFIGT